MAKKDESLYHATQDLILATPRKYYQDNIVTSHWQLRSLVSSPEQNIIYYPRNQDIVALNTETRLREVISSLTFTPRCLVASKDWVLCGGEDGKFSAIRLAGSSTSQEQEADARLPLEFDSTRRGVYREHSANAPGIPSRPIVPTNSIMGTEIVNCITIWSPTEEILKGAYTTSVAVVSNNDCTISFLDLRDSEVIDCLTLPDCVNRSVMSPCGTMLASVCDDPFLYIHERQLMPKATNKKADPMFTQKYEWVLTGRYQMQGQKKSNKEDSRGSFAVCFSKSGRYLAAATQYGIISVFETASMTEDFFSPHIFTTSRPGPTTGVPGAVRAMEFSNGPYDLLVWTESKGRFCVADVRNMFLSRQLITIDPKAEDIEQISVIDEEADAVIDSRLRSSRTDLGRSRIASDLMALEAERRQIRQLILDRYDPPPFSASETQVLHASQAARRQRENARNIEGEASIGNAWSSWNEIPRSSTTTGAHQGDIARDARRISTTGLPPVLRDFVTSDRTASFRSFINDRNRESERRNVSQQESDRRGSAMLAANANALEQEIARFETEATSELGRLTLEQTRLEQTRSRLEEASRSRVIGSDNPNNPWADIDALYRSRYPAEPIVDRTARLRVELEVERRRDLVRPDQPWRAALGRFEGLTGSIGLGARAPAVRFPGDTMGCCWSQDGTVLYIGAGEGIYEYRVNVEARKRFPSIVMR